jgi:hypothetical protein
MLCTVYQQKYKHFYIIAKYVYKYINMLIIMFRNIFYKKLITKHSKSYKHVLNPALIQCVACTYNENQTSYAQVYPHLWINLCANKLFTT